MTVSRHICRNYICTLSPKLSESPPKNPEPVTHGTGATVFVWFLGQIFVNKSRTYNGLHQLHTGQDRFLYRNSNYFLSSLVLTYVESARTLRCFRPVYFSALTNVHIYTQYPLFFN